MKLADVDVYELVHALGVERSAWLNVATEENRRNTEAERITICVLAALESALKTAASSARIHRCQRRSKNASAGRSKNTSAMVAGRPRPGGLSSDIRLGLGRDYLPVCLSWHGVSGSCSD
jgi:hypothetical protein